MLAVNQVGDYIDTHNILVPLNGNWICDFFLKFFARNFTFLNRILNFAAAEIIKAFFLIFSFSKFYMSSSEGCLALDLYHENEINIILECRTFKNVSNYLNSNIYSCLETSGGQRTNLYLNVVYFFNARVD